MQIIPLIKIRGKQIIDKHEAFLEHLEEGDTIYVYDLDGIEKSKPALCYYQKLSKKHTLWVDSGPRNLGDVVDVFLAGAASITIRKKYYPQVNIENIRELSENKVYTHIRPNKKEGGLFFESDGIVAINTDKNQTTCNLIKKYTNQKDVFVYEPDKENINYLLKTGIKGLIVDIEKFEETKKWIQKKKSL